MSGSKDMNMNEFIKWCEDIREDYKKFKTELSGDIDEVIDMIRKDKTIFVDKNGMLKKSEDIAPEVTHVRGNSECGTISSTEQRQKDIINTLKETNVNLFEVNNLLEKKYKQTAENNNLLSQRVNRLESELAYYKNMQHTKDRSIQDSRKFNEAFFSSVSHNFRTPLTSIVSSTKIIQRYGHQNTETIEKFSAIILDESDRLLKLVVDCLDLMRLNFQHQGLNIESVAPESLIGDLEKKYYKIAQEKNLIWKTNIEKNLPKIYVDSFWLTKAMGHLVENALKFNKEHGEIIVSVSQNQGKSIVYEVRDTGIGIGWDDSEHIFDLVLNKKDAEKEKSTVIGMGLSITKQIVEQVGGKITFDSREGQGSSFRITIPLDSTPNTIAEKTVSDSKETKIKTILHVDDDKNLIDVVRLVLRGEPYHVVNANRGSLAHQLAREQKPDLILLDIMMPDMSGYEVLDQLKNDPDTQNIPVVALSVSSEREKSLQHGAHTHITKPMNEKKLIAAIHELIQESK